MIMMWQLLKATGETSAKVAINKTLNIAEGITTPKATFRFTLLHNLELLQMMLLIKWLQIRK